MSSDNHNYQYYNQINGPSALGMSGKGDFDTLTKNVDGLTDYIKLLIEGTGRASKTGEPPGNRYFVNTNAKCKDVGTAKEVDRYMYIDNQPNGDFSIGGGMGTNFDSFEGLIPGILSDLIQINPERIFDAFEENSIPKCRKVRLKTISSSSSSFESHHVPDEELKLVSPCAFSDKRNPVTRKNCETFVGSMRNMDSLGEGNIFELDGEEKEVISLREPREPRDIVKQMFIGTSGIIVLYLFWKFYVKQMK